MSRRLNPDQVRKAMDEYQKKYGSPVSDQSTTAAPEQKEKPAKPVYNHSARAGDPYAWRCLSNEDRDVINEWFQAYKEMDRNNAEKQKAMFEKTTNFAFIPFAVIYGYTSSGYDEWSWTFLWNTVAAYICFVAFFYLCKEVGESVIQWLTPMQKKSDIWFRIFEVSVAVLITVFCTLCILNAIYH